MTIIDKATQASINRMIKQVQNSQKCRITITHPKDAPQEVIDALKQQSEYFLSDERAYIMIPSGEEWGFTIVSDDEEDK